MSTLASIADKQGACGGALADTGKLGCPIEFKTPMHLIRLRKGTVIPKETEINIDYINTQTQKGIFVPLMGAETFERMSSEDTMSTNLRGVERLGLKGLPKYKFGFEEGHVFYRELSKLTAFKASDFIVIDEDGTWKMGVNSNGDYVGLDAGQVLAEMTMEKELGGNSESKNLIIQFLDRDQWDINYKLFTSTELGIKVKDINGVNGVSLSYDAIPADGETVLNVTAVFNMDMSTLVGGLLTGNFVVKVNGATVAHTFAETSEGKYALTISALTANQKVEVDLFDTAENSNIIINNGILYRSDAIIETVAA